MGTKPPPAPIRTLVDNYYRWQEERKRITAQLRTAVTEEADPGIRQAFIDTLDVLADCEKRAAKAIRGWGKDNYMATWATKILGIGPIIAAGLSAHIDITKCPCASSLHKFAGLAPGFDRKKKGTKCPFNADLKRLCFLIGDSFVKISNNPNSLYGAKYRARKEYEVQRNDRGEFAEKAALKLKTFKMDKGTPSYKEYAAGRFPPGHLDAMARRWTVKEFLAEYFNAAFRYTFKKDPPDRYAVAHLGHVHKVDPQNYPRKVG